MASSFEKSVKGATKIKLAPPKSKYVEHILVATHAGEAGVAEVFRTLQNRLRDTTWTIVFKALIVIHLMIREGEPDVTLKYLAQSPARRLAINNFTEVQTQGHNIRAYSEYIMARAKSFGSTRVDYVKQGEGRLKRLSVDKGLLRETEQVQDQIHALLQCDFLSQEPENEITLTAFRLLTMDLLALFHVMNEGTINVLEHYFEMSHPDAERALRIYRMFCRQTDAVVQYLSVARLHEHSTRLEIPKIKHAPTSLASSLEEYLNDKDFEVNRRQYLAQQDGKKGRFNGTSKLNDVKKDDDVFSPKPSAPAQENKGPAPDLIDFFESIEQNQQPMAHFQQSQMQMPQQGGMMQQQPYYGFAPQPTGFQNNPFAQQQQAAPQPQPQQLQPNFTGAGFGGFGPQPQQFQQQMPQQGMPQYQQPQFTGAPGMDHQQPQQMPQQQLQPQHTTTNPFRASMLMTQGTGAPFGLQNGSDLNRTSTNPFAKSSSNHTGFNPSLSAMPSSGPADFSQQQPPQPLQPTPTGTNPFARPKTAGAGSGSTPSMLLPTATGSTNPFRQSAFVNQQTGQGWQNNAQASMGGLEQLETVPVFPRPGQPNQQQPQHTGWST
ncbi:ENTH domain-containing protein [Phyllosticta citrichinensis]|uniref:ENTH domain-containing protein n=1 Tax=Phyllosticta citrichinensis TaxID=1130410 RepID=A0ABR1Y034_9PEZI